MTRTIVRGSVEYLEVSVTAAATLDAQPVELSFDRTTWLAAAWTGTPGTTRTCRLLLDGSNIPATGVGASVWVRITDGTEVPVLNAGAVTLI